MPNPSSSSPVSARPQSCPYEEYVAQQQRVLASCRSNGDKDLEDGPRLLRQMMIGFTCACCVGLVMLVLGTVFITDAIGTQQPITVMLCVMGIVFGIIIIVGTLILGKLLISRKWIRCRGQRTTVPTGQCFHTCSVIYSTSLDQLGNSESMTEPPPTYDSVMSVILHPLHTQTVADNLDGSGLTPVMVLPPKYDEVTKPLPEYLQEYSASK
uniref:Uncharacterized protein n=1 Tax=Arion vulgaris TaxID=1028688 RepID=A0A0B6YNJ3_9EUPU